MVNSGPCDFFKPKDAAQERALQEQPGRHVHRRDRQGGRGGRHLRHGRGRRATTTTTAIPDILVTAYGRCILYHNNGDGTFTDVTEKAGVAAPGWTTSAVWFDYDNDGRLDLFLCSFVEFGLGKNVVCGDNKLGRRYYCIPRVFKPTPSLLFHNNGDGTFTEVSKGTDIAEGPGQGPRASWPPTSTTTASWTSSWPTTPSRTSSSRTAARASGRRSASPPRSASAPTASRAPGMGVDAADFDGDGWQDLFVANVDQEMFALYRNNERRVLHATSPTATASRQATRLLCGWGLKFFDFDNDGNMDLFLANGHPDDMIDSYGGQVQLQGAAPPVPQRREAAAERQRGGGPGLREGSSRRAASPSATSTTTGGWTCSSATTARRRSSCATARGRATTGWA